MALLKRLFKEEDGQGMVEYGLIIALVAVVLIGALVALRGGLQGIFTRAQTALDNPEAAQ
ncbi:MAG: Flp family type IVb pilin [Firmicutes bacterium]|nr:Flp family type IVb pilin [Bacillota bacterium]MDH7495162.1 Flp family type IVb pilin [Bacillota bacterium]